MSSNDANKNSDPSAVDAARVSPRADSQAEVKTARPSDPSQMTEEQKRNLKAERLAQIMGQPQQTQKTIGHYTVGKLRY